MSTMTSAHADGQTYGIPTRIPDVASDMVEGSIRQKSDKNLNETTLSETRDAEENILQIANTITGATRDAEHNILQVANTTTGATRNTRDDLSKNIRQVAKVRHRTLSGEDAIQGSQYSSGNNRSDPLDTMDIARSLIMLKDATVPLKNDLSEITDGVRRASVNNRKRHRLPRYLMENNQVVMSTIDRGTKVSSWKGDKREL